MRGERGAVTGVKLTRLRAEHGASAVEFALVAPLLFGLLAMAFTGGLAFTHNALVHRSAEHAARVAAVPTMTQTMQEQGTFYTRSYATEEEIGQAAADAAILFQPTSVEVACRPAPCSEGGQVTVRVTYAWDNPVASLFGGLTRGREDDVRDEFLFTGEATRVVE